MNYHDFIKKWNNMPLKASGFLSLNIEHQLNFQIGYHSDVYKSLVIMDAGVIQDIPSSFAIKVVNMQLQNGLWVLEFQLLQEKFEDIFLRLCWDIIDVSRDAANPLNEIIARYLSWQKFLQYSSEEALSVQRQKGLLGELLYIRDCISIMCPAEVITAWTGSEGSDQDFVFGDTWTEVKAVSLSADIVTISSLQQLEHEKVGQLTIYTLEKSTSGRDRVCLPNLVKEIKDSLLHDIQTSDRFEMKLFKYGYRESEIEIYQNNQYRYIERRDYLVDHNFPKIIRHNVAHEVVGCTYTLSLAAIDVYRRK